MKAVILKDDLIMVINKIHSLIPNKPAIPIVSNFLIEATNGQVTLSATDLTNSISCSLEAKIIEEGSMILPAKKFFQLIRELTSPQIKISKNDSNIAEIISGSSVFKIMGAHRDLYPSILQIEGNAQLTLPSFLLKEMLSKIAFAIPRDSDNYILNGAFFNILNKQITIISTNGKRIAKLSQKIEIDPSFQGNYVLPVKAVEEMIKVLDDSKKLASLKFASDKMSLEYINCILTSKLLSGQYPNCESVIPKETTISIPLHKEELTSLLKQIGLFMPESSGCVKFIFTNNQLTLMADSKNIGEGNVNMPIDYQGERFEIAFNPFYFLDILKHSRDEVVNLSLLNTFAPGVITDSSTAIYTIMPMRFIKEIEEELDDIEDPALT